MYNDKAYHKNCIVVVIVTQELSDGHSKSHSPQCLQCHVDFEGFSKSHTSFNSNKISIKTVLDHNHEDNKFYALKHTITSHTK